MLIEIRVDVISVRPFVASSLLVDTFKGNARYRELNARFLVLASTIGTGLNEPDIRKTSEIVRRLSDEVKGLSERLPPH